MNLRAKRRSAQRKAFVAYLNRVQPVSKTWTGWKLELLQRNQAQLLQALEPQADSHDQTKRLTQSG